MKIVFTFLAFTAHQVANIKYWNNIPDMLRLSLRIWNFKSKVHC